MKRVPRPVPFQSRQIAIGAKAADRAELRAVAPATIEPATTPPRDRGTNSSARKHGSNRCHWRLVALLRLSHPAAGRRTTNPATIVLPSGDPMMTTAVRCTYSARSASRRAEPIERTYGAYGRGSHEATAATTLGTRWRYPACGLNRRSTPPSWSVAARKTDPSSAHSVSIGGTPGWRRMTSSVATISQAPPRNTRVRSLAGARCRPPGARVSPGLERLGVRSARPRPPARSRGPPRPASRRAPWSPRTQGSAWLSPWRGSCVARRARRADRTRSGKGRQAP